MIGSTLVRVKIENQCGDTGERVFNRSTSMVAVLGLKHSLVNGKPAPLVHPIRPVIYQNILRRYLGGEQAGRIVNRLLEFVECVWAGLSSFFEYSGVCGNG